MHGRESMTRLSETMDIVKVGAHIALDDKAIIESWLKKKLVQNPLTNQIAALSVGIVDGDFIADLDYEKDSSAQVDLNLVLNDNYEILEIQGTAEQKPFSKEDLDKLFEMTKEEVNKVFDVQKNV